MRTAFRNTQKSSIDYLLKQDNASYESHLDGKIKVVRYAPKGEYLVCVIFKNKSAKPISHYRYNTEEQLQSAIDRAIDNVKKSESAKAQRKQKDAIEKEKLISSTKVGDIFYTSWGYDQTNVDFYQIVGIPSKSTVEYVSIGSKTVKDTGYCSSIVSPDISIASTDVKKGRIGRWGIKIGNQHASKTKIGAEHHSSWGY